MVSCGCKNKRGDDNSFKKKGLTKTRVHSIWVHMIGRCNNPSNDCYYRYGGRGISVCDEWADFFIFNDWAYKNGYSDDLSIDRINNDGNYEPGNCRWATTKQQGRNKCDTIMLTYNGETKPLRDFVDEFDLSWEAVRGRIRRGWTDWDMILSSNRYKGNHLFKMMIDRPHGYQLSIDDLFKGR
jgi:hypothetical protein